MLAAVHCAAALAGFAHIFPDDAPKPTPASLLPSWDRLLTDPAAKVLVADSLGEVVGCSATRPDPAVLDRWLLERLYVHPDSWGRAVASALHDAALESAAAGGAHRVRLQVLAGNDRARRMYERRGWRLLPGTVPGPAGVPEVQYELDLSRGSAQ